MKSSRKNQSVKKWTDLSDVKKKLTRIWGKGSILRLLIDIDDCNSISLPLRVSLAGPSATEMAEQYSDCRLWVRTFTENSSGFLYEIEWKEKANRQIGKNSIPSALLFHDIDTIVQFISKKNELRFFKETTSLLIDRLPVIKKWIIKKPLLLTNPDIGWKQCVSLLEWILKNPQPSIYTRQIPVPDIDSKFIEKHRRLLLDMYLSLIEPGDNYDSYEKKSFEDFLGFKKKPILVRLRFLDSDLFINGLSGISVRHDELDRLDLNPDNVFVVENDINALSFPIVKKSLVIFGRGYGFSYLKQVRWLERANIWYWGDIDTHGFIILDQFKKIFPNSRSLMMDYQTLMRFRNKWVREPKPNKGASLNLLSKDEKKIYELLSSDLYGVNMRLEQEFVDYTYVVEYLRSLNLKLIDVK
ncbi:MAG: hypothetical protein JXK07_02465 [Spirochaetes bacterium]|nr:hypothetical protein [Spirochaetota bacterium]MBN2769060.1 hypothetical protein [Spirochaetota bacterium]